MMIPTGQPESAYDFEGGLLLRWRQKIVQPPLPLSSSAAPVPSDNLLQRFLLDTLPPLGFSASAAQNLLLPEREPVGSSRNPVIQAVTSKKAGIAMATQQSTVSVR